MVKIRVIAGCSLLPLLLIVVLVLPKIFTAVLFATMASVAAYELLMGTGIVKMPRICIYSVITALWCVLWCGLGISAAWLWLEILLLWCALFIETMMSGMKVPFEKLASCLVAGVILPMLLASVVRIHNFQQGRFLVLIPFAIAFLSDTGAYFTGLRLGKHKLAPEISPKKTVEGLVGGVLFAVFGMIVYCLVLEVFFKFKANYLAALLYGIAGSLAGVFGDLCFSVIKRQTGIKDYGNLIPGHGGILDRFDSMIVVGPLIEVLLLLLPVVVK